MNENLDIDNSNMEKIIQVLISLIEEQEDVIIEYEAKKGERKALNLLLD